MEAAQLYHREILFPFRLLPNETVVNVPPGYIAVTSGGNDAICIAAIGLQWSQQAVQHRPRGIGLVRNTYTFPIRKAIVCGEERSGFFDCTRFCSTYKWVAVGASTIPHCRKAVDALGVAPY